MSEILFHHHMGEPVALSLEELRPAWPGDGLDACAALVLSKVPFEIGKERNPVLVARACEPDQFGNASISPKHDLRARQRLCLIPVRIPGEAKMHRARE